MTAPPPHTQAYLDRAYALSGSSSAQTLYDEWAGAYDADLNGTNYASPRRAVETLVQHVSPPSDAETKRLRILDAGCGTGLVGSCLAQSSLSGKFVVDGVDISEGMLVQAREKGVYSGLWSADLTTRIEKRDGFYDVVLCVGTLTKGHVGPRVLGEFVRLTSPSGWVVATVLGEVWEGGGYKGEVERLEKGGDVEIVSTDGFGILDEKAEGGIMVVLRKK